MEESVVSQYSFGQDDGLLEDEHRASIVRFHQSDWLLGVKFNQHFPWLFDVLDLLPFAVAKSIMPIGMLDMVNFASVTQTRVDSL